MEKVFTVMSFFLLVLITSTFPLNSASASCCGSSSVVATASGCTCDDDDIQIDMENLALLNVSRMMMKLHTVSGLSFNCDADAPESHGLENSTSNSAESPSSGCTCDIDMENLAFVSGLSLTCDADAPESHGLENSTSNSAESPSSESSSKAQPDSTAPAPAPAPAPYILDRLTIVLMKLFIALMAVFFYCLLDILDMF